jgi:sugar lactone lactonase YvrE
MLAGDVLELDDGGAITRTHVGKVAAVIRPRPGGGAIVALEHGFALTDGPLSRLRVLPPIITDPAIRLNEGGCDPAGNFYCGSMAYDSASGAGTFYCLRTDGSVGVILPSVTISNGFAFGPDRNRAYYVDTPTRRIDVFDYAPGDGLTNRRPWVSIPPGAGGPDGLTVDAEGCVWVALFGGSAVRRYSANGQLDGIIELPVKQVTACAFGGDRLYITTSRLGSDEPEAGALFAADVGIAGPETLPYLGSDTAVRDD